MSDAIAALGLPPGKRCLGRVEVEIHDNMATVAGLNTLAGRFVNMRIFLNVESYKYLYRYFVLL